MKNFEITHKEIDVGHARYSVYLNANLSEDFYKGFDPFIKIAVRLKKIIHLYGLGMCLIPEVEKVKNGYIKEVKLTFLPNTAKASTAREEHRLGQWFELLFKGWVEAEFFRTLDAFFSSDWSEKYNQYCQSVTELCQEDPVLEELFDKNLNALGLTKPPSRRPSDELLKQLP